MAAALALVACATTSTSVIAERSLAAVGFTFAATVEGMNAALDAGQVDRATYDQWKSFGQRFEASYEIAVALEEAAEKSNDPTLLGKARAIVADFQSELDRYAALLLQVIHPDGGT